MKIFSKALSTIAALVFSTTMVSAASVSGVGPYFSTGSCALASVSGGVTSCYGAVLGPSNAQQVNVNGGTFYSGVDTSSSSTTGLFGIQKWKTVAAASSGGLATFGQTAGTFTITNDLTSTVAVMLKAGNTWSSYLFNSLSAGTYSYNLAGISSNALSNVRVVAAVPVPAAAGMLALGLGGLAFLRRRQKIA